MFKRIFLIFLSPFVCVLAQKTIDESSLSPQLANSSIVQIITQQPDSVEYLYGEKLHLKQANIFHTSWICGV